MPAKPAVSVCSFLRESQESEEKGQLLGNGLFGDGWGVSVMCVEVCLSDANNNGPGSAANGWGGGE